MMSMDRKIDITVLQFLLVQKRHQTHDWSLIGSGANGIGIQEGLYHLPPTSTPFLPMIACRFYLMSPRFFGTHIKLLRTAARWLCSGRESSPTIYSWPIHFQSSALISNFSTLLTQNRNSSLCFIKSHSFHDNVICLTFKTLLFWL